jgi:hypothetical protein
MVEGTEGGIKAKDPLLKIELLASILAVDVGEDAADGSAVSGVLEVIPAFELFLLSAPPNSGTLGTESVALTVKKLHIEIYMN